MSCSNSSHSLQEFWQRSLLRFCSQTLPTPTISGLTCRLYYRSHSFQYRSSKSLPSAISSRAFKSSSRCAAVLDPTRFGPTGQDTQRSTDVRDEKIRSYKVIIAKESGGLGDEVLLRDALEARKVDERGKPVQYLRQVRPPDAQIPYPVCKYYDKKLERDKQSARKKATKASKIESKQLEINWTVGDNDLSHRMGRLKEFLEKGARVEVIIGSSRKKGWMKKRTDDTNIASQLVDRIRAAMAEVQGAKERAEMTGKLGEEIRLSFEGPKRKPINSA